MLMTGTHSPALVVLSVLIAMAASFTALDLAARFRVSTGTARLAWLATAALAMGGGIWAMHFVGMLAFSMPGMEVTYDVGTTLLSLAIPVAVTGFSFLVISRAGPSPALLALGGALTGASIVAMHYLGMAAMRMPASLHYQPGWVAASVLIAFGAASVALWLSTRTDRLPLKAASAIAMGVAIAGMHYTAMQGAVFTMLPGAAMLDARPSLNQITLAVAVAASTFLILFMSLIAAMFDRRFAVLADREAGVLRRSEERFRSLYRRTPLPLHSLDRNGWIEEVTEAWLELMGYTRDEVIGRPLINFLTEASARQAVHTDWPALLKQGQIRDIEYRVVTKAGAFRDVVAAARVEWDDGGGFVRALGGLTDVTDRKHAEDALRQVQKMEAVGQLTGGVAHDFNNLLSVILGNLDLLQRRLGDDPKSAQLLDNATKGARRGASLTQRMLAFARKQDLAPEPVDLPQLVRGMTDLLQRSLGPAVAVETRFPLGLPAAHVDGNQLELVLLNLAVNARDAMPEGGTLTVSAAEHSLPAGDPSGLPRGHYICLSVADTGIGMDAATLARAAEPFFTTKGLGKGTGLGLSMTHGLAAQSGGRLLLRSEPGQGTTAELWLPAVAAETQPVPEIREAPAEALPRLSAHRTVLVVDDDPLVLASTAAVLEELGCTVLEATSGAEALQVLRAGHAIDIVVTDFAMPGMTGLQLAEAVRSEWPHLPLLLVSGYADMPSGTHASLPRLGKPFTQQSLAQAVEDACRNADQPAGATVIPLRAR